jgi:hypothetical protein
MFKKLFYLWLIINLPTYVKAQVNPNDSSLEHVDTLRIINFNPHFIQHVDSVNVYQFKINRDNSGYYWYLKNAPVGLSINKDNGLLTFKYAKNYFLSGKLQYDFPYQVNLTVHSLLNKNEKVDTSFSISFYNTEIIPSKIKLSVPGILFIEEGENVSFKVQCETGSFPFENILFGSSVPIRNYNTIKACNDEFNWLPGYDFVKPTDSAGIKIVTLSFIGVTKFGSSDTATVKLIVKNSVDYAIAKAEYEQTRKNIQTYILQLKYAFLQLDRQLKKVKTTRTAFDLTSATTALSGTILSNSGSESQQNTGRILPGVGVALVPLKEATAPAKTVEQNQASMIRGFIRRLEYVLTDNALAGDKDPFVVQKTNKLKDELKQIQVQLIDIPIDISSTMTEKQLNDYFNNPKVNKKYRVKR